APLRRHRRPPGRDPRQAAARAGDGDRPRPARADLGVRGRPRAPRCSSNPSPTDPGTAVPARPHDPEVTMTDAYPRFIRTAPGRALAGQLGLPRPARLLRREDRPEPVLGPVVVLGDSAGADRIA